MGKNTAASFAGLNKLSVVELGRSIERVVRCERQEVAAVIAHLAEMARRDAHLSRETSPGRGAAFAEVALRPRRDA